MYRKHREKWLSSAKLFKPYLGRAAQALDIHCPGNLANSRLVIDLVSERKKAGWKVNSTGGMTNPGFWLSSGFYMHAHTGAYVPAHTKSHTYPPLNNLI